MKPVQIDSIAIVRLTDVKLVITYAQPALLLGSTAVHHVSKVGTWMVKPVSSVFSLVNPAFSTKPLKGSFVINAILDDTLAAMANALPNAPWEPSNLIMIRRKIQVHAFPVRKTVKYVSTKLDASNVERALIV